MISEAIDKITDLNTKSKALAALVAGDHEKLKLTFGTQEFLFDSQHGGFSKSRSLISREKTHSFGTVAALTAYLKDLESAGIADKGKAVVLVSSSGITVHLDEEAIERHDLLTVPFFKADMPPEALMNYEQFLTYLDQQSGKIQDEDLLREQLSVVRVVSNTGAKVIDQGAVIRVEATASETVESGAVSTKLPKYININLRIGTREFEKLHKFRLHITPPNRSGDGGLSFRLTKINRDGALEAFMEDCMALIREQLGEGWRVYEGPCR